VTHSITDELTPAQRRQEVAAILGRGLLRSGRACGSPPESPDQKALDVSAPSDPYVSWLTEPRS
jgi:hypothetical protein